MQSSTGRSQPNNALSPTSRATRIVPLGFLLLGLCLTGAAAQTSRHPADAEEALRRARDATTPAGNLIRFRLRLTGRSFAATQAPSPDPASEWQGLGLRSVIEGDLSSGFIRQETTTEWGGGYLLHNGTIYGPDGHHSIYPYAASAWIESGEPDAVWATIRSYLPPLWLATATDVELAARDGEEESSFGLREGAQLASFDADSGLMRRLVTSASGSPRTFTYQGQQIVGNVRWPTRIEMRSGETLLVSFALLVDEVNGPDPHSPTVPDSYRQFARPTEVTAHEVQPGVFQVSGASRAVAFPVFVARDGYLVAFDAPLAPDDARRALAAVRQVVGDLPLRYVVVSHHHADHRVGVAAYVEAGAQLVASPDTLSAIDATVYGNFQPLEITDERQLPGESLVVHPIPAHLHAREMLALAVDGELVVTADTFAMGIPWNDTYESFRDWLVPRPSIRWIVGVHHELVSREFLLERELHVPGGSLYGSEITGLTATNASSTGLLTRSPDIQ